MADGGREAGSVVKRRGDVGCGGGEWSWRGYTRRAVDVRVRGEEELC